MMNSEGPAGAGRGPPSHPRGHRPHRRGAGGDRGHGRGGGSRSRGGGSGGGRGAYGGHRGGRRGGHSNGMPPEPLGDPSLDPQLAPKPPHPGYFHTSFLENPWYELEEKLGIPHLKPLVSNHEGQARTEPQPIEMPAEQPPKAAQETAVAAEPSIA